MRLLGDLGCICGAKWCFFCECIFRRGRMFVVYFITVVSCVSEIHQTGFRDSASRHSCWGRLEARLSLLRPSAQFSRLCTILQDFQHSHLGCPCILSSASGRHLTRFLHGMLYDRSLSILPVLGF